MDIIKFSTNWNHKLSCNVFTTIRPASQKYKKGNQYLIEANIKDFEQFKAECLFIFKFKIYDIPELCYYLDTGYSKVESIQILSKLYPSNFETLDFFVILLKKVIE
jgi:hypothetical protein